MHYVRAGWLQRLARSVYRRANDQLALQPSVEFLQRAGSDKGGGRAAAIYSLIETAKLNRIDPEAYHRNVLTRTADHSINRIAELLPWKITAIKPA